MVRVRLDSSRTWDYDITNASVGVRETCIFTESRGVERILPFAPELPRTYSQPF